MKLNRKKIKEYLPFILMIIIIGVIALGMNLNKGDDIFFKLVSGERSLLSYLQFRYSQWTGRLVIESILWLTSRYDILFRILHPLTIGLLGISLYKLLPEKKTGTSWLTVILIALIPIELFISAGWIATNVHYIWVGALGVFSLISLKKICEKKTIKWFEYIFYFPAVLYASNNEQMFVALALFYAGGFLYLLISERKFNLYIFFSLGIMALNFINMLFAPGNMAREADEIAQWFPTFGELSIFQKFDLGLASSLFHYLYNSNFIYLALCIILVIGIFWKKETIKAKTISLIPLVAAILLGFVLKVYELAVVWMENSSSGEVLRLVYRRYKDSSILYGDGFNIFSIKSLLVYLLMIVIVFSIIYSIYKLLGNRRETLLLSYILGVGLITRAMMGISPTIWISGVRTFMIFYLCLMYVVLYLYQKVKKNREAIR